ncbi:hypothetical protein, partial [Ruminococcus callidus]|uniref:hypothetical protein n=1 Tax=Ruminococcus callidus TaxID=40519 RepID=UPI0023F642E3
ENLIKRFYEKTSPPPNGGPPPLSGEVIMKIDFRGQHFCRIDKKISVCYDRVSASSVREEVITCYIILFQPLSPSEQTLRCTKSTSG